MLSVDRMQTRHYGDGEKRYYSVTQVCRVLAPEQITNSEEAMQRGTDVHMLFSLLVGAWAGWCSPPNVPQPYEGYCHAIRAFIEATNLTPVLVESASICTERGFPFAGTPDCLAELAGIPTVIELKTGVPAPWHRLQVQAYKRLKGYRTAKKLLLLYLASDGTYVAKPVLPASRDKAAFNAALSVLVWREMT